MKTKSNQVYSMVVNTDNNAISPGPAPDGNGCKPRILYAEDCENNVLLVTYYLKGQNCTLDIAENGLEAVKKFTDAPYDLVLMDIQMPIMDGYEATRSIREFENENEIGPTPIIAITAHAMEENRTKALEAGCDAFMTKPVRRADFLNAVKTTLTREE